MSTTAVTVQAPKKWVGQPVKRKEDTRLLTGRGRFIDDLKLAGMRYAAILRSPYPHAKIVAIDTREALEQPGVLAVITGKDVAELTNPMAPAPAIPLQYYPMAIEKVRFVGEPVALVVASSRYQAEDALDHVRVEYAPLEPVVSIEDASREGAPLLHESLSSNLVWHRLFNYGDVEKDFSQSDGVILESFSVHRVSSTPIETFGVVASYDKYADSLTIYSNSQIPGALFAILDGALKTPHKQLRIITGDIGGSYGVKLGLHYLVLLSAVAMKLGVPVKYVEDRKESMLGLQHGTETKYDVEAAVMKDGRVKSLKVKLRENVGAYPQFPEPEGILEQLFTGAYKIGSYRLDANLYVANKCMTGPCRGYGRYNVAFLVERVIDATAEKFNLDPIEVRLRNFIGPGEFPYTGPNGNIYDSGDYAKCLKKALEVFDYEKARAEQREARKNGRKLGIGVAFIVEIGTPNFAHFGLVSDKPPYSLLSNNTEIATVSLNGTGRATVMSGMSPQGQGQETALAQVVADELGLSPDEVAVDPGFDSNVHPFTGGSGTYGSRFGGVGVSCAVVAARKVRQKLLTIAGFMLGEDYSNLDIANGLVFVKTLPQKAIPVHAVCGATMYHSLILPKDIEPTLSATAVFGITSGSLPDADGKLNNALTYASCAHVGLIEVDDETGKVKVLRYVAVDDCGKQINPMIVEGQSHGSIAHALGWSLFEELKYGEDGQLEASTFMDYLVPTAAEMPSFEVDEIETLSPYTPLGSKGIGEGGSMPVMPLIASAIEDALGLPTPTITQAHQSPEKIWKLGMEMKK
ncbi:MAG TPA: xanthine dehydrogenase family protein molybdopterin-binding subunit [Nitrososphaerales archaeon]|nr:xanthine dehydrogenase family protein molybdopterin-binding subunit [Nitrososphaerales archaeon]